MSYWQLWDEVRNLPNLDATKRADIIKQMSSSTMAKNDYHYIRLTADAIQYLTKDEMDIVFDNMIANYPFNGGYGYQEDGALTCIKKAYELNNKKVKDEIAKKNTPTTDKALLLMNGLTVEEESRGLRAVSANKYCPNAIYEVKYAPSIDAINLLPPVMRLKVLETLSNNRNLAYNVFRNFTDPDEFKTMMFSSVMRHRDRAEIVWNKYKEISYLGQEAIVSVKGNCSNCGSFDIDIKSTRIRTKIGLQTTRLWGAINANQCVFCGKNASISISGQSEGIDDNA